MELPYYPFLRFDANNFFQKSLVCHFFIAGQIRGFLTKIRYKMAFSGPIVAEFICKGDFQPYCIAKSGDYCSSEPFFYLFSPNSDPNQAFSKIPLPFKSNKGLFPLFQSLFLGDRLNVRRSTKLNVDHFPIITFH